MSDKKGIDVAKWNGTIDWTKAKADGVQFAILKAINKQRVEEDAFARNYKGAHAVSIPLDVYNYSYATSVQIAISDAQKVLSVIQGKDIETVWMDVEDNCQKALGMKLINMIAAYQDVIEKAGYKFGVYTGLSFYNSYIKPYASHIDCKFWIARYPSESQMTINQNPSESKRPEIVHDLCGWQYSSKGKVDGIEGSVDLNILYDPATVGKEEFPTLRKGSKGYYVGCLQEKLNALGYICGTVDKDFGSKTELAVEEFQYRNGLTSDGVVGSKTWAKLYDNPVKNPIVEYSLKKDGNVKISSNFTVKEFKCKDGSDMILIDTEFVKDKLQKIRDHFKVPITINSGYRTAAYNKKVGGSTNSYHMKGQAFDIVVCGKTPAEVAAYAYQIGIPGIIQYNTFVHVDSRATKYYERNNNGKVTKVSRF